MSHRREGLACDGFAMVGALLALLLAALFGSAMAGLARTELRVARNGHRLATALAAIDECAARVVRGIPLGWDFAAVLAGVDTVPGTGDDGVLAAPSGCRAVATALAGADPRLLLELDASRGGGRRLARAVLGRARHPGPGALLWLAAGDRAGLITGRLRFDGTQPGRPAAAAAAPDEPVLLDAWLAAAGGRIELVPGTRAPLWAPAPPLADVIDAARDAGAVPAAAALTPAAPAPEAASIAEGDLVVGASRWARGVLVVTGRLTVAAGATLDVDGLLVAADGVRVALGGALAVRGALWAGGGPGIGTLEVAGDVRLVAAPAALARAATSLTLPHEARVLGWLDR